MSTISETTLNKEVCVGKIVDIKIGEEMLSNILVVRDATESKDNAVSIHSPVGKNILNKKEGDKISVIFPDDSKEDVEIIKIKEG